MKLIAGVDIGNSTTEVCIGQVDGNDHIHFLSSVMRPTTGIKGTTQNIIGIKIALESALEKTNKKMSDLDLIRINEAAPVVGGLAMETVTETIITNSAMLGHNPDTPAGVGHGVGILQSISNLPLCWQNQNYILLVPKEYGYEKISQMVNAYSDTISITGLILQNDEAVLVENRLNNKIPIIDEVKEIQKIPEGKLAAIEVAPIGESIHMLSNPYGIATLLHLTPEETKMVLLIAKSLIGNLSAVVIKTPHGKITENKLPSGEIVFCGERERSVHIDKGAVKIMEALDGAGEIKDIFGEPQTNIGQMLDKIKNTMAGLTNEPVESMKITGLLAVDTFAPVKIIGGVSGETCLEKAVGIAAMVRTQKLPMERLASQLKNEVGVDVKIAGVEAVMAILGAMTTPGTGLPLAILDLGGGSTDAALIDLNYKVESTHLAGAGELVTNLIATELGVDTVVAEQIKRCPLAKVESLFHMRMENGETKFFQEPLEPKFFGHIVLLNKNKMIHLTIKKPMEKIALVRREAKEKVFLHNAIRALRQITKDGDITNISNVVLVGGSSEDFEITEMLTEAFASYGIVCGRGNIRKTQGPRNAVATGLVMSQLG